MILQRNGSSQGQTTHSGAEQHQGNDDPRQSTTVLKLLSQHLFDKHHEIKASQIINTRLSLNGGSVQTICFLQKKARSATIGSLGMAVFRRQMQQARCLVLFFHIGELFHQIPGVLRRHFPILLPFDARQFGRRHNGMPRWSNLRNAVSMWPLQPSDVT